VATSAGSSPRIDHFGFTSRSARAASSAIVDCVASTSPERRQHVADVAQEAGVGADHQHALAGQLLAVGEQQVRRPVQADRRLARARCTLHADRLRQVGADDHVLLGLDRGDDVAHRPHARALDLLLEDRGVRRAGGRP
jgi:hypothetical protein